jgi:cytochrome c-type biogenesis protein CcmH/NrfG
MDAAAPEAPSTPVVTESAKVLTQKAQGLLERGGAAGREQAFELAERAVAQEPGNAEAWLTLGAAQQALGKGAAARASYKTCTQRAGSHPRASECRALAGL